jgi:AcrR family transcriptional regulator
VPDQDRVAPGPAAPVADGAAPATRAGRRARTRAAILDAARETFAARGFEKATIRAVARRAGYDPALVMQHFGSKTELFREATAIHLDLAGALAGPPETQTERILSCTFEGLDAQATRVASTLRTMLTHDDVAGEAVRLFHPPDLDGVADGPDAEPLAGLRRELVAALTLGTAITRYVLKSPAVEAASREDLLACLLPAVAALRPPPIPSPRDGAGAPAAGRTPVDGCPRQDSNLRPRD